MSQSRKRTSGGLVKYRSRSKKSKYPASIPIPRNISTSVGQRNVTSITRSVFLTGISGAAGTDQFVGISFQLSDLPNIASITGLYDQYRIMAVRLQFIPQNIPGQYGIVGATVVPCAPQLLTCIDLDDAVTPGVTIMESHETVRNHGCLDPRNGRDHVVWVEPAIAMENYQTGGFGGYTSKTKQWCDAASTSVQHYGVKAWVFAPTGTPAYTVNVFATYYMEFRMPF